MMPTEPSGTIAGVQFAAVPKSDDEEPSQVRHTEKSQLVLLPLSVELNRLENEADQVTSKAVGELFSHEKDPIEIIKWREVYGLLESATDRAEDAANVIEAIVLKHA